MAADAFPVLRIRANGPTGHHIQEISLDGHALDFVRSVHLSIDSNEITTATITIEVVPDIDLPVVIVDCPEEAKV